MIGVFRDHPVTLMLGTLVALSAYVIFYLMTARLSDPWRGFCKPLEARDHFALGETPAPVRRQVLFQALPLFGVGTLEEPRARANSHDASAYCGYVLPRVSKYASAASSGGSASRGRSVSISMRTRSTRASAAQRSRRGDPPAAAVRNRRSPSA
jgi:hypothetical protein